MLNLKVDNGGGVCGEWGGVYYKGHNGGLGVAGDHNGEYVAHVWTGSPRPGCHKPN